MNIEPIAYIHTDFDEKFGIPRQSGRVRSLTGRIVFVQEYRKPEALRGIDGFSHLWLLFDFSLAHREGWSFERIEKTPDEGDVLIVSGVDLLDMTPIYDIKPYIPYADCHEDAVGGYADRESGHRLDVVFPDEMLELIPDEKRQAASDCLADDPRPAYQNDPARIYSMAFAGFDIRFTIDGDVLRVTEVVRR